MKIYKIGSIIILRLVYSCNGPAKELARTTDLRNPI